ncbi:MAG: hypothetical protein JXA99_00680 [Candidatus Lokiarchaeota archaeon]|nr:hypothetical protein [Candidatus Lokiarchaeota archaeon]
MSLFESKLIINLDNLCEIEEKLKFCEKLNIKNIILEPLDDINIIKNKIKQRIKEITPINIYYRICIKPKNLKDFKNKIKLYHNCSEIICVESSNLDVQIHAARDSRVDIISFTNLDLLKSLSKGIISLVNQNNSFIEFTLAPIMSENISYQSKTIRHLFRSITKVINSKSNYIISGGFSETYNFRNPRALVSICHTILGIPFPEAKKAFNQNVIKLINRAKSRQSEEIYEEGVRIIKGG